MIRANLAHIMLRTAALLLMCIALAGCKSANKTGDVVETINPKSLAGGGTLFFPELREPPTPPVTRKFTRLAAWTETGLGDYRSLTYDTEVVFFRIEKHMTTNGDILSSSAEKGQREGREVTTRIVFSLNELKSLSFGPTQKLEAYRSSDTLHPYGFYTFYAVELETTDGRTERFLNYGTPDLAIALTSNGFVQLNEKRLAGTKFIANQ